MEKVISNRLGWSFPFPFMAVGGFMVLGGLLSLGETLLGFILIAIGLFPCVSTYGIQIDVDARKFRNYTSYFGFKRGTWEGLDEKPFVSVLNTRTSQRFLSRANNSTTLVSSSCDVCLLSKSHREKTVVEKFDMKEPAIKRAEELALILGFPVVRYSPVISEKTKSRRR